MAMVEKNTTSCGDEVCMCHELGSRLTTAITYCSQPSITSHCKDRSDSEVFSGIKLLKGNVSSNKHYTTP